MENSLHSKIAKEKLTILYIIKKSNYTLTYNNLSNLILEYNLINYFEFVEYFNELSNSNFIENRNGPQIKLTDFSLQTLELLEGAIDKDVKDEVDFIFSSDPNKRVELSEFQLVPLENGNCIVKLSVKGDLDENFLMEFTVENIEEGKKIESSWKNKNKSLYREIVNIIKNA